MFIEQPYTFTNRLLDRLGGTRTDMNSINYQERYRHENVYYVHKIGPNW
jgi:hypothetical protein